jgi:hypothetical protein
VDVGIPVSLLTPNGEIVFNVLTGDATDLGLSGLTAEVAPIALPDGNGYHLNFIGGNDGADIRNPITARPHTDGAIIHSFRRQAKYITVEGLVVASGPEYRSILDDALVDVLDGCLTAGVFGQPSENNGRLFWKPAGQPVRFHTVHLYSGPEITGPGAQAGGSPAGIAGPKTFSFSLVSEHSEALTYTQDVTDIEDPGTVVIPNAGNTATWPVVKVYAEDPFTLTGPGGYQLVWGQDVRNHADEYPPTFPGAYIEIDMFRQTMYWDGDGANALIYLGMQDSDFFTIPAGGGDVTCDVPFQVLSNAAWVG